MLIKKNFKDKIKTIKQLMYTLKISTLTLNNILQIMPPVDLIIEAIDVNTTLMEIIELIQEGEEISDYDLEEYVERCCKINKNVLQIIENKI